MKNSKQKISFEDYYSELFGKRWPLLKESLLGEAVYAELSQKKEPYFLDPASLCAALCLPLKEKKLIADLCAAPGGKTLVTALGMDKDATLDANERSPQRKNRLVSVLDATLTTDVRERITVTCSDAAPWCRTKTEYYDAILLDVPCSSERHVLLDPKYLNMWTPNRIKTLSMEQWALLSSAWRMLKPGGSILYATCALSPLENDRIVEKLTHKFEGVKIAPSSLVNEIFNERLDSLLPYIKSPSVNLKQIFLSAEKTEYGFHLLPDTACGTGPLYFSLLSKFSQ